MRRTSRVAVALVWGAFAAAAAANGSEPVPPEGDADLLADVERNDLNAVRVRGAEVMAGLIRLYRAGDEEQRARVAAILYGLGWKSAEAAELLLADVHTKHESLRLNAQWALGRVSDSPVVVEVLLENMMSDPNPLFRDKAACALAYDQIHLSEARKVRLFEGLIDALDDPKPQVRAIALQALKIHTGQDKGFAPMRPEAERAVAIARWREWLDEYRAQL